MPDSDEAVVCGGSRRKIIDKELSSGRWQLDGSRSGSGPVCLPRAESALDPNLLRIGGHADGAGGPHQLLSGPCERTPLAEDVSLNFAAAIPPDAKLIALSNWGHHLLTRDELWPAGAALLSTYSQD